MNDARKIKTCSPTQFFASLVLLLWCSLSTAETFSWKSRFSGYTRYGNSPTEACTNSINASKQNGGRQDTSLFKITRSNTSPVNFSCWWCSKTSCDNPSFPAYPLGDSCADDKIFNQTTGECAYDQQKGPADSCPSSVTGNPINFSIGNKFQTEIDYKAHSNSTLKFSRNYNSLDGYWRHNHSTHLRLPGRNYVALVMADGQESFFTFSATTVTPTSNDLGVLTKSDTGWQYTSTSNEQFIFDIYGKLTRWSDVHGAVHQFTYTGNQVVVTDNLGNSLSYTEDANRQPLSFSAPGAHIDYGYNTNKRLVSVRRTINGQTTERQFHYEDTRNNALLTGLTDERGTRYATWRYDDKGRATSSEHADAADHVSVLYNLDGTVSVTNELGKVSTYSFVNIQGVRRISAIKGEPSANCPNSNSTFTYDNRGLLKTKTDNKGNVTAFDYNERGLEVSRTEAYGTAEARTTTTEWHPTLFLPAVVTEPNRTIRYHYDDQGRQLSRTVEE